MIGPPSDDARRCSVFTEEGGYALPRLRILGGADNDRQEEARHAIQRRVEDDSSTVKKQIKRLAVICRLPGNLIEHIVYGESIRGSEGGAGCCVRCSGRECCLCRIFLGQYLMHFAPNLYLVPECDVHEVDLAWERIDDISPCLRYLGPLIFFFQVTTVNVCKLMPVPLPVFFCA